MAENEIIGKTDFDLFPYELAEKYRNDDKYVIEAGQPITIEEEVPSKEGIRYVSTTKTPVLNENNAYRGIALIVRDITERKQAEEAMHNLLTRLQLLAKHLPGFLYQYQLMPDGSSVFPYASSGIEAIYGLSHEEAARDTARLFTELYPDDLERVVAAIQHSADTLTPWHDSYRVRHPNGRLLWVEGYSTPIRQPDGSTLWHGYIHDITKRKQAEEALRESQAFAQEVLNSVPEHIAVIDRLGTILTVNESWRQFSLENSAVPGELSAATDVGANYLSVCSSAGDDARAARSGIQAVLNGELPGFALEYPCHSSDQQRWFSMSVTPMRSNSGGVVVAHTNISERKQMEDALQENQAALKEAQRIAHVGSWEIDLLDDRLTWSDEIFRIFEIDKTRFGATYAAFLDVIHPADRKAVNAAYTQSLATRKPYGITHRLLMPDGRVKYVHEQCESFFDADGKPLRSMGTVQDITERMAAYEKLQLAASVFSTAHEGIMITDTAGTLIDVNDAFTRITGFGHDEVIGKNPRILSSGRQGPELYAAMWRDLQEKGHWYGEFWNRRKNGEVYAVMQTISTVRDPEGHARHYVSLFSDITSIKEHQNQLEHIAHYDALTRLPNRVLLADRLQQAIAQARRRGSVLAVAFLDLDGFKAVNDHHGHKAGDELLIALSARMKDNLREGDTLARIGGDEFVTVLVDLSGVEDCVPMLTRLLAAAAEPVPIGELTVQVSASLGVTFYPQEEDLDADQLQRQADQAMYRAKLAGKNRYHVFDAVQDRSVRSHHESMEDIRRALVEHEFVLYYQPKVNLRSGAVIGAEALIRWQHPQKGLLAPAAFLPVIEDHPLAIAIGEWVIETALTQRETWRAAGLELPVSVNVDVRQLQQPDFVQRLHALLLAHPASVRAILEIEVLETSALEDIARVSTVIEACREWGVAFALDDFGTGYSSLTYLKRLAVTVLKIDQSFVRDMLDDPDDLAILEGVIGLASAFRRVAIAEGVETVAHGEMLLQLGCELAQGYGIARPMPADQMPAWAAAWITPPAWANCQQISHDHRPLLHAAVEHRAWIMAEERYLKGERAAPPPLDPHHCRFGLWLETERRAGRDAQPGFFAIDTLHQQIHTLADELCQLRTEGRAAESVARLDELYRLRDALLGHMKALETSHWRSTEST